ncbi:dTMP kinase [Patescibacteria group bacterium]|nr:dTMP kinase [Patescibacteria group bacterium]
MPGTFIVFEGPDGSGTTLHAKLLEERLSREGLGVLRTFEPTDGPIGAKIRESLHSGEPISPAPLQELFCKDRAWHLENVIQPALAEGTVVICDRYLHSTLAYGQALGLQKNYLRELNKDFIQPDVLFFLLPPYEVCSERMSKRKKHDALEENTLQRKVYDIYLELSKEFPEGHVIDNSGSKAKVSADIFALVQEEMRESVKCKV